MTFSWQEYRMAAREVWSIEAPQKIMEDMEISISSGSKETQILPKIILIQRRRILTLPLEMSAGGLRY